MKNLLQLATLAAIGAVSLSAEARGNDPAIEGRAEGDPIAKAPTKSANERDKKACDDDDESDECTCTASWRRRRCKGPSVSLDVIGVRPALTNLSTATQTTSDVGVGFAGSADSYALNGATHASMQFMLGGGQAGFEGQLAGVIELGHRIDVTEHQGPFGRIGFDGRLQGNDAFYYSALELPRLTAGWQFATRRTVFELGARGGPILTGRFNPGDGVRHTTGSWEFGGLVAAQVEFLRLEGTAFRMDGRNTGDHTPVDVGRGTLCGVAGRLGICADFMALQGSASMGGTLGRQDALATYMGVTFGAAHW
jgi:hypothetical protein